MYRLVLLLLFSSLLIGFRNHKLDCGKPSINAVCEVTLQDGSKKQGLLCIISGGYDGFHKHGFAQFYPANNAFQYNLFNINSYKYSSNSESIKRKRAKGIKVENYFMQSIGDNSIRQSHTFDPNTNKHHIAFNVEYTFDVLDEVTIYQEIPLMLYLPNSTDNEYKSVSICVEDIQVFRLLEQPKEKWTTLIANARKRIKDTSTTWVDYQAPLWYHELKECQDKYWYKELAKSLGKNNDIHPFRY